MYRGEAWCTSTIALNSCSLLASYLTICLCLRAANRKNRSSRPSNLRPGMSAKQKQRSARFRHSLRRGALTTCSRRLTVAESSMKPCLLPDRSTSHHCAEDRFHHSVVHCADTVWHNSQPLTPHSRYNRQEFWLHLADILLPASCLCSRQSSSNGHLKLSGNVNQNFKLAILPLMSQSTLLVFP